MPSSLGGGECSASQPHASGGGPAQTSDATEQRAHDIKHEGDTSAIVVGRSTQEEGPMPGVERGDSSGPAADDHNKGGAAPSGTQGAFRISGEASDLGQGGALVAVDAAAHGMAHGAFDAHGARGSTQAMPDSGVSTKGAPPSNRGAPAGVTQRSGSLPEVLQGGRPQQPCKREPDEVVLQIGAACDGDSQPEAHQAPPAVGDPLLEELDGDGAAGSLRFTAEQLAAFLGEERVKLPVTVLLRCQINGVLQPNMQRAALKARGQGASLWVKDPMMEVMRGRSTLSGAFVSAHINGGIFPELTVKLGDYHSGAPRVKKKGASQPHARVKQEEATAVDVEGGAAEPDALPVTKKGRGQAHARMKQEVAAAVDSNGDELDVSVVARFAAAAAAAAAAADSLADCMEEGSGDDCGGKQSGEAAEGPSNGAAEAPGSAQRRSKPKRSLFWGVTPDGKGRSWKTQVWDKSGRSQVHLGSFGSEEEAARAYDRASIAFNGTEAKMNFPVADYQKELSKLKRVKHKDVAAHVRSVPGFSAGGASGSGGSGGSGSAGPAGPATPSNPAVREWPLARRSAPPASARCAPGAAPCSARGTRHGSAADRQLQREEEDEHGARRGSAAAQQPQQEQQEQQHKQKKQKQVQVDEHGARRGSAAAQQPQQVHHHHHQPPPQQQQQHKQKKQKQEQVDKERGTEALLNEVMAFYFPRTSSTESTRGVSAAGAALFHGNGSAAWIPKPALGAAAAGIFSSRARGENVAANTRLRRGAVDTVLTTDGYGTVAALRALPGADPGVVASIVEVVEARLRSWLALPAGRRREAGRAGQQRERASAPAVQQRETDSGQADGAQADGGQAGSRRAGSRRAGGMQLGSGPQATAGAYLAVKSEEDAYGGPSYDASAEAASCGSGPPQGMPVTVLWALSPQHHVMQQGYDQAQAQAQVQPPQQAQALYWQLMPAHASEPAPDSSSQEQQQQQQQAQQLSLPAPPLPHQPVQQASQQPLLATSPAHDAQQAAGDRLRTMTDAVDLLRKLKVAFDEGALPEDVYKAAQAKAMADLQ